MDDRVWDASTFSHNRERLLAGEVAQEFLAALVSVPEVKALMSREHFLVDGTLIDAWACHKSFVRKGDDGPPSSDGADGGRNGHKSFRDEKRSNATHASTTDPDARRYRKADGRESRLCFIGHVLITCSRRTGTGWWWARWRPAPPVRPSARRRWRSSISIAGRSAG